MKKETLALASHLEEVIKGEPWFGRAVFTILDEIDESKVFIRPDEREHSLAELLYHMITWASFTEKRLRREKEPDLKAFEKLDWRKLAPATHTWNEGVKEFKEILERVVELTRSMDDDLLDEKVEYRDYDFRTLITGITEHTIYHLGQVAYLNKLLT
jgi:uncharacterized damage-inducible protein DinB